MATVSIRIAIICVAIFLVNSAPISPPTETEILRVSRFLDQICAKIGVKWSAPWQAGTSQHVVGTVFVTEVEFHSLLTFFESFDESDYQTVVEATQNQIIDRSEKGIVAERALGLDLPMLFAIIQFVLEQYLRAQIGQSAKRNMYERSKILCQWLVEALELVRPVNEFMSLQPNENLGSHIEGERIVLPLYDRMHLLRMLWILSATTSNSEETRHLLLEAIRSANISPELVVSILNIEEFQQILHAQRRIDGSFWHSGSHRMGLNFPNEVIGQFLDVVKIVGEQMSRNRNHNNYSNQAASSQSAMNKSEEQQNKDDESINRQLAKVIQDESTVTENQQGSAAAERWQAGWEEPKCAICLEEFEENDVDDEPIEYLPCGHSLHKNCMDGWRAIRLSNQQKVTCPVCRLVLWPPRRQLFARPGVSRQSVRHGLNGLDSLPNLFDRGSTSEPRNQRSFSFTLGSVPSSNSQNFDASSSNSGHFDRAETIRNRLQHSTQSTNAAANEADNEQQRFVQQFVQPSSPTEIITPDGRVISDAEDNSDQQLIVQLALYVNDLMERRHRHGSHSNAVAVENTGNDQHRYRSTIIRPLGHSAQTSVNANDPQVQASIDQELHDALERLRQQNRGQTSSFAHEGEHLRRSNSQQQQIRRRNRNTDRKEKYYK